jgi:hypothetical protein
MMESNPHACGVDDIASLLHTQRNQHAFGVDEGSPTAVLFPVPFPEWVTSTKHYWGTFAKHRSRMIAGT